MALGVRYFKGAGLGVCHFRAREQDFVLPAALHGSDDWPWRFAHCAQVQHDLIFASMLASRCFRLSRKMYISSPLRRRVVVLLHCCVVVLSCRVVLCGVVLCFCVVLQLCLHAH
jgi:hypothetical protein